MNREWQKKKWLLPLLLLAAGALLAETAVCNFSAWKSLLYRDRIVYEQVDVEGGTETAEGSDEYIAGEEGLTVRVPSVDKTVRNLFFALDIPGSDPVPYTVTLTDEGNYYPYALPEQVLIPGMERTFYTNLYPSGKVGELSVQFMVPEGSAVKINAVCTNAHIPFVFSPLRFLVILAVLLLLYETGNVKLRETVCGRTKGQKAVTALVILLLMAAAWKLCHINPVCINAPWPHHKQYQELAEAMAEGHFYLEMEPSEGLLQAPNPYDTIYLQANGIDYRADYAYFEGRYYVYFGVVPELLLYLPCYLLTGHHLPNYMAVFLFYCGFIAAVFALLWEAVKRWFPRTPFYGYLLAGTLTVMSGNYLFVIARPDLYDTPIMAANMFTAAGLWLWIKGKYEEKGNRRKVWYGLGSLCMALVAGCRPQMLLFSFLAVPLFWDEVIKRRELFSKKGVWDTVWICLPYVLTAAGLMYYNGIRFGSPFDFGATYSLTSNDMTKRGFHLHQALLGLWHYFLKPPVVDSDFPFLQGIQIASGSYMGKLNAEYTYGGMLAGNVFLWFLFYLNRGKAKLKEKGVYVFIWVNLALSVVISLVDVTGAGILQRYMVDMIWGIWLAAVLVLFGWLEDAGENGKERRAVRILALVFLAQAAYGICVVLGNGDLSVNVRTSNPEVYYGVKNLLQF